VPTYPASALTDSQRGELRLEDLARARLRTDLTHLFGLLGDGVLAARYPLAEAMELAESSAAQNGTNRIQRDAG
jgi:hypothetical protein